MGQNIKLFHKTVGITALVSLVATLFPNSASAEAFPTFNSELEATEIAQANNCREVNVNSALNVRSQPNGAIIGTLQDGEQIYLTADPNTDWVEIDGRIDGYVYGAYLSDCNTAQSRPQSTETSSNSTVGEPVSTVSGSNCRAVNSPSVAIREVPGGRIIETLDENESVFIANEGRNGWVPIERPVSGYITAANLKPCDDNTASRYSEAENRTVPISNCRETNTANVPVYTQPGGSVVGTLDAAQSVYIANEGRDGWVPIETPINGYVDAANLTYCTGLVGPTFPTSSCRKIKSDVTANLREQPGGTIIGSLPATQNVSIQNRGQNGWVPVVASIQGYVAASNLEYCP